MHFPKASAALPPLAYLLANAVAPIDERSAVHVRAGSSDRCSVMDALFAKVTTQLSNSREGELAGGKRTRHRLSAADAFRRSSGVSFDTQVAKEENVAPNVDGPISTRRALHCLEALLATSDEEVRACTAAGTRSAPATKARIAFMPAFFPPRDGMMRAV
jgi:hypothetical protein